ncbi:hypothetical protein PPERSA_11930 [Pseudocohnilembus persalinus]|uniref:Transmembrane protein n=1 Tax=Pseudocohnilembus persalinus TaxID=266149 RepID=A0A0V0QK41_PSEPJ|nr:hypothetical protein PPERSA_11930 [Pseudocohnilembus persalinus]|eukprot:KRX02590.1 hypothetical protein PPERSA_11930 [Pseudocohnilembus persalinus]
MTEKNELINKIRSKSQISPGKKIIQYKKEQLEDSLICKSSSDSDSNQTHESQQNLLSSKFNNLQEKKRINCKKNRVLLKRGNTAEIKQQKNCRSLQQTKHTKQIQGEFDRDVSKQLFEQITIKTGLQTINVQQFTEVVLEAENILNNEIQEGTEDPEFQLIDVSSGQPILIAKNNQLQLTELLDQENHIQNVEFSYYKGNQLIQVAQVQIDMVWIYSQSKKIQTQIKNLNDNINEQTEDLEAYRAPGSPLFAKDLPEHIRNKFRIAHLLQIVILALVFALYLNKNVNLDALIFFYYYAQYKVGGLNSATYKIISLSYGIFTPYNTQQRYETNINPQNFSLSYSKNSNNNNFNTQTNYYKNDDNIRQSFKQNQNQQFLTQQNQNNDINADHHEISHQNLIPHTQNDNSFNNYNMDLTSHNYNNNNHQQQSKQCIELYKYK